MSDKIEPHLRKMDAATQTALKPFFATHCADEWVREVLLAYFNYFLTIDDPQETEQTRRAALRAALGPLVPTGMRRSLDKEEEFLYNEFRRKGYSFLGGRTGPYYGPYIWKRSERRTFDVELTDRHVSVDVFFMYEFLVRSWMHFQTFGEHGTGGWVKRNDSGWEDGLYCVADAYDLERLEEDLVFQVSLLKHEGQHFADQVDFPNLSSADLEYRAKLTELIYYPDRSYRFESILQEAAPAKNDPHRYAAYWIVRELSERILREPYIKEETVWGSVPYERIQTEARGLLQEHSQRLRADPQSRTGLRGEKRPKK